MAILVKSGGEMAICQKRTGDVRNDMRRDVEARNRLSACGACLSHSTITEINEHTEKKVRHSDIIGLKPESIEIDIVTRN